MGVRVDESSCGVFGDGGLSILFDRAVWYIVMERPPGVWAG
jgi:hypothetical protein